MVGEPREVGVADAGLDPTLYLTLRRRGQPLWPLDGPRIRRHRYLKLSAMPVELRPLSPEEPQTGSAVDVACGLYDPALVDHVRLYLPGAIARAPKPPREPTGRLALPVPRKG